MMDYGLEISDEGLGIMDYDFWIVDYELWIMNYKLYGFEVVSEQERGKKVKFVKI